MKKGVIILFSILLATQVKAQFSMGFKETDATLNFSIGGNNLLEACAGGLNNPQFSTIDLDLDGIKDLFIFDRSTDVIRTFLFNPSTNHYDYAPQFERFFPKGMDQFALLKDFDCDGKEDIFTYYQAAFRVYRNTSIDELNFEKVTDKIRSNYGNFTSNAYVLAGDIPALVDVDNDGDLDILTFGTVNSENTIEFHRNLSQDLYNHCDSLIFEVPTQCWGKVQEPSNSSLLEAVSCKGVIPPNGRGARHAGSTVLLIDTDNDGDKDLILGDVQTSSMVYGVNIGDENEATIDVMQQTTNFPNSIDPVDIRFLAAGYELDVDHDGILDLLISSNNSVDSSFNTAHVWHYKNMSSTVADYQLQRKDFLVGEMLDLGSNSDPETMDVNGDGLLDLLISSDYAKSSTQNSKSRIYYFQQESNGSFSLIDDDFAGLSALDLTAVNISLGDLDNDGDQDLIVGDGTGALHYFENTPIGSEASFSLVQSDFMGINILSNASPELADINGDGKLDLLVGELLGSVNYFENTGSATNAFFASSPTIQNFGGIDISQACCVGHAHPKFVENAAFGTGKYLFVGSDEKRIDVFEISENLQDSFPRVDSLFFNAGRLAPLPVDFDGDGIFEMLCGTGEGGLKFYSRTSNFPVSVSDEQKPAVAMFKAFPNPADLKISMTFEQDENGVIEMIDMSGRVLITKTITAQRQVKLNIQYLESGVYFLKFTSKDGMDCKSISILR